ncbi:hypothetical protein HRG_013616 [Hirsutella rhossiliensis]
MIQVLESTFGDPNEITTAADQLAQLGFKLNGNVDIHDFIAEFDALAAKSQSPPAQMKNTLWRHITADLDASLLSTARNPAITYEMFCEQLKDCVYSKQRNYQRRQEKKAKTTPSSSTNKNCPRHRSSGSDRPSQPAVTSNSAKRALTDAEKRVHWDANTCFVCGKMGHKSIECPNKINRIRGADTDSSDSNDDHSGKE